MLFWPGLRTFRGEIAYAREAVRLGQIRFADELSAAPSSDLIADLQTAWGRLRHKDGLENGKETQ